MTRVETGAGPAAVDAVRDEYDAIAPLPVTARWAWLRTAATCFPAWRPLVVSVRDGDDLVAAAMLGAQRSGPLTVVTLLGHARSDYAALPARDSAAALALANGVADALYSLRGPWRVRFAQVPAGDPVLHLLGTRLRCAEVTDGDGAPAIVFDGRPDADAYANRNLRKQLRKARNRIAKNGLDVVADTTDDIEPLLPEMAAVHVARDHEARGRSDHDDERVAAFWSAVLRDHAARGEVEATTMRVDGGLVAYSLCFRDGPAYRFWDSRFAPGWDAYSFGRLLDHDVVDRVIAGGWAEFDWMRGVEAYKLQAATTVRPYEQLTAWSSPAIRRAESAARSARDGFVRARSRAGRAGPAHEERAGDA